MLPAARRRFRWGRSLDQRLTLRVTFGHRLIGDANMNSAFRGIDSTRSANRDVQDCSTSLQYFTSIAAISRRYAASQHDAAAAWI